MFSRCFFIDEPPQLSSKGRNFCLIYDSYLTNNESFKAWEKHFHFSYPVKAGEDLKDINNFPQHMLELQKMLKDSKKPITIVAAGGGSVGDFTGFVASVYKRGVPLIHVPTTYLAALDSAHGGKTALNVGNIKNQVGTFYPAEKIYIVKEFLKTQTEEHLRSACGELVKIAFIQDLKMYFDLQYKEAITADEFWEMLPSAIEEKYKIVAQDPEEKTGHRQILNLGHTFGHLIETQKNMPHGLAVAHGLGFALKWSHNRGILNKEKFKEKIKIVETQTKIFTKGTETLDRGLIEADIKEDKKKLEGLDQLNFIFVRSSGEVSREPVTEIEFIVEAERQGWL